MSCAACSARVEKAVAKVPGVTACSVSLLTNSMGVEGSADPAAVIAAVEAAGYGAATKNGKQQDGKEGANGIAKNKEEELLKDRETPVLKRRLIASLGFLVVLMYFSMGHMMWGWPVPKILAETHVAASLGFLVVLMYFSMGHMMWGWPVPKILAETHVAMGLLQMLLTIAVMIVNQKFFVSGFKGLWHYWQRIMWRWDCSRCCLRLRS